MVNSYKTLLADGSIAVSSRPQSSNSRHRLNASNQGTGGEVTVYSNNLYDGGDILAAEIDYAMSSTAMSPSAPKAAGASQKFQQQRALAAQKRMERLQMGGVAHGNDSIAVVNISSRPGTSGSNGKTAAASSEASTATSPATNNAFLGPVKGALQSSSGRDASATVATLSSQPWTGNGLRPSSAAEENLIAKGLATVYDPNEDLEVKQQQQVVVDQGHLLAAKSAVVQGVPTKKLDLSDIAAFLVRPGPKVGTVQCYIEREKGSIGRSPCYRLHLDDGGMFLLAARKRKKSTSSAYVISSSQDADDLTRSSSSYIGKLRSNFVGTEFTILSNRSSSSLATVGAATGSLMAASSSAPARQYRSTGGSNRSTRETDDEASTGPHSGPMQEVAAVQFDFNVLGTRGPRKMTAAVPAVSADGGARWRPAGPNDNLLERLRSGHAGDMITVMRNKTPKWNDSMNAYCLNFQGRVTEASVKNFQLVTDADPVAVVLQFGKISEACFTCDFMWPLSPLQAFCICLASFDNKLACE